MCVLYYACASGSECMFPAGGREECAFVAAPRHPGLKCHAKELPRSGEGVAGDRGGWQSPKLESLPSVLASQVGLLG